MTLDANDHDVHDGAGGVTDDPASVDARVTLSKLLDDSNLDATWEKVLTRLRAIRFSDLVLLRDPIEWAGYEWDWSNVRDHLKTSVYQGRYRPRPADQVRAAKSKGLTRIESHLRVEDAVLYRALIDATREQLDSRAHSWTRSGRQDEPPTAVDLDIESEYGAGTKSWWEQWVASQKAAQQILDECELIVESDISNCFPSIRVEVLASRLAVSSTLDHVLLDLLTYLIHGVGPPQRIQQRVGVGLPIEPHNCSRTLAQFLLSAVDDEFKSDGESGIYGRFVDDVFFGAQDIAEAQSKLGRFQNALEQIGLYPNSSKTHWFTPTDFEAEYHSVENNEVGEIQGIFDGGEPCTARDAMDEFIPRFLAVDARGRGWVHWYNTQRIHGYTGDIPPAEFEDIYHAGRSVKHPIGNQNIESPSNLG